MNYINTKFLEFENKPMYQYWLLAIITLLAATLRFYRLGEWSFWYDELFAVVGAQDGFNDTIVRQSISLVLIQAAVNWLGTSEWSARLVPALVGIISVPVLYFPVKKMFGPAVALTAIFLLAVSPWHLYWSQNARFYVPLLLFYTLALITFYIGLEEDHPWYLFASLILLALAAKERLLALFFVPVVVGYIALLIILPFERPPGLRWRNFLIFALPGAIGGLLFAGPYLINLSDWLDNFSWANNHPLRIFGGVVYYVGPFTVCTAILGGGYLLIKKDRASLLLALGAIIPLLTIMGLSTFHYTSARYVFISLTSWIFLASLAAIKLLFHPQQGVKLLALGASLAVLLNTIGGSLLYFYYENGYRDNSKAAYELVERAKRDGDLVAAGGLDVGNYYLQDNVIGFNYLDVTNPEGIEKRVWFVEDSGAYVEFPEVGIWLEKNAQLVADLDVNGLVGDFRMRVYLYDPVRENLSKSTN